MDFPDTQDGWEDLLAGKFDRKAIVEYLKDHQPSRADFLEIILLPKDYAWRAAWLLRSAFNPADDYRNFIDRAIGQLPNLKDGHQREVLKTLELLEIDESCEGPLFDACMNIWESPGKSPSVRMSAFLFILKIVAKYPDLKSELDHLTQPHFMESLSPGVKRSLEKRVKALEKKI